MAGDSNTMFDSLPGSPRRPRPPPSRGLRQELMPVNPGEVAGGLYDQGAEAVGQFVANEAGQPLPGLAPNVGLPNADLLGKDVTGFLQSPKERLTPGRIAEGTAAVAPFALAAKVAPEARTAEEIATGVPKAAPIVAYHGSPYSFDRFDASKIGTGEGAQAYGHGLYFAENEAVAKQYRDRLARVVGNTQTAIGAADRAMGVANGDKEAALASIDGQIAAMNKSIAAMQAKGMDVPEVFSSRIANEYQPARDLIKNGYKPGGSMYQVGVNADPSQFLDWDKPLSEQPQPVQNIANDLYYGSPSPKLTGKDIYHAQGFTKQADASEALQKAGIPGIRYLDQGSRDAGGGTSNYVMFDPSTIDILRKYGLAGPLAAGGAGALMYGQGQQQGGDQDQPQGGYW